MMLLWKAVVLEVGVQAHPQKVWFDENLGKSPENSGKNGTQRCLCRCNEHKLSAVSSDRAVHNCKNMRQRVKTGE